MGWISDTFGTTSDGQKVDRYSFTNSNNIEVQIISFGGIITSIKVPDKTGKREDIVTGFDNIKDYEINPAYFGAIIGRVANRIHKGKFTLDGEDYSLAINNGPNCLHGGIKGFDKKVWDAAIEGDLLKLSLTSPDGEENFPGTVKCTVTYELNNDNELVIDYSATTDKTTLINLTNHAYFNLAGHKEANVYDHTITLNAEKFTPKNEDGIPTGEIAGVNGTVFDLRSPTLMGQHINNIPGDIGYDHNFCITSDNKEKKFAAKVEHEASGRVLETYTNQQGVQLYTGNYLNDIKGKDGACYGKHGAFCLETQVYPDAIHHTNFPSCVLKPGETYRHTTWYKFSVKN